MTWGIHSIASGSSHRVAMATMVLLAILALSCRAQAFTVNITIGSNNRSTAILPARTEYIIVVATEAITLVNPMMTENNSCVANVCTIYLPEFGTDSIIMLHNTQQDITQTLSLTIRESLNATCAEYNVPKNFTKDTELYTFNCQPLLPAEMNRTDTGLRMVWRKFRYLRDLESFIESRIDTVPTSTIVDSDVFNIGDRGYTLTVNNSVNFNSRDVAFFYLPVVLMGDNSEVFTAETLIFVGPMIMEDAPEFSKEVTFDSGRAQNYTEIKCETDTFPPAKVSWLLISDEYPCPSSSACGRDVARLESTGFSLLNSGSRENLSLSIGAIIEMLNLQYEEDGNFTCTADNGYASASRTFILRVKSPLRPLWPAVGIILVVILVALIMFLSFSVEKIVEGKKSRDHRRASSSSPNHTHDTDGDFGSSISSSGGQSNSRRNHSAVKRLSSAKPLIDESTL